MAAKPFALHVHPDTRMDGSALSMNLPLPEVETRSTVSALVRTAAAGDVAAFERLYRDHVGRVHGAILRLVGTDRARAEELTQGLRAGVAEAVELPPRKRILYPRRTRPHGRMQLESMSGDIRLRLPAALSAHVEATTFSGSIGSDYGAVQDKGHGPGSNLDARVGEGDTQIHVESFSGDIELRKQGG